MTQVAIEVTLPAEHQNVTGVMEHRTKLAAAAAELGWGHHTPPIPRHDWPTAYPSTSHCSEKSYTVGVGLHWEVDSDEATIHQVVATIRDQFDVEYATVDGVLIPTPVEAHGLAGCLTD
ncbi:hypothetical protein A5626_01765 [Mycobacterium marseillense]|uniref:hypothetical protein n=1 Tax=Mycobacterium marseillense TaxID=701042 RepID=UPI0007FFB9C6|nr:hypothetical protein [Mycobacterium marseillense]MCA2265197.1 hypothetical protein [Mycobacterium marseillense]OBJ75036.1 hypothetical protein A5626_01765 [Mycobacterium marseillense]